jgi:hypothetical protein
MAGMLMALAKNRTDDDLIGAPVPLHFPAGDTVKWLDFKGDGGFYQVGFKIV